MNIIPKTMTIGGQDIESGEFKVYMVRKCHSAECKNPAFIHLIFAGKGLYYCVSCARWMIKVGDAMGDATPRLTARVMRRSEIVMDDEPPNTEDFAHNKAVFDVHEILYSDD